MLHGITADQGACTTQTGLAVDGQGAPFAFANFEEVFNDIIRRCRTINEKEIRMVDTCTNKLLPVIFGLIESNNSSHIKVLENLQVVLWGVATFVGTRVNRTHESNELVWNNPVQVTVFNFLIVLVFFVIKIFEHIPTVAYSDL